MSGLEKLAPQGEGPEVRQRQASLYPEALVKRSEVDPWNGLFLWLAVGNLLAMLSVLTLHIGVLGEFGRVGALHLFTTLGIVASLLVFRYFGRFIACLMYIANGVVALLLTSYLQGGITAPALAFCVFPVWLAALLLRPRWAALFGGVTVVGAVALLMVDAPIPSAHDFEVLGLTDIARFLQVAVAIGLGAVLATMQVRARTRAEEDLLAATERARAMLDSLPDTFVLLTPSGEILEVRIPDDSVLQVITHRAVSTLHALLEEPESQRLQQTLDTVVQQGVSTTVELCMVLGDEVVDVEARISRHPEGNLVALLRDISAQKRSGRIKDDFVSMVSHELRTPLTSIHGSLALLRTHALVDSQTEQEGVVELAWRNSQRLGRLIDDLLDVQKMEEGQMDLRFGFFDAMDLLGSAVDANRSYALQYGVTLDSEWEQEELWVRVDDDRFHQVVSNLLSNAIKYSPQGGTVVVGVRRAERSVRVVVSDRGTGIPESFRAHVFERFAQADSSETRAAGGTGLGLSICKRLVVAFGGEIGFEAREQGGTLFWFDLPLVSSPLAEPAHSVGSA